jgi:trimethylamine--corrinoid protein Co-methyltransferase
MKFLAQILSAEEQARVHTQSLRILSEIGARYYSDKALGILSRHGARIDRESKTAWIPADLVEHALQTVPKSFVLGARNPAHNYLLPSSASRFCMDGTAAFAIDWETGQRRYGVRQDIVNAMRILEQMDMAVMAWPPVTAFDAPAGSRALHEFFTMLRHCSRHGQHELHTVEQAPFLAEGLKAVLGSEDEIRARKNYSLIYCPVAPLSHDGPMMEAYLELGALDIPVMVMPMPVGGTTGPASLYSNICQANAELLSALVVFQLAQPGRPIIYSSATGSMDFTSGGFLGGTPEMGLQSAALTMMGRYYDLPSTAAGCTSDARQPGPEAVLEKLITTIPPVLVGADIIIGIGEIEGDQTLVLEQMVVDNEIAHFCQRLFEGVDTSEQKDLLADIARVGPGGNFLKAKSTRRAARSGEFYMSRLLDRHAYEAWLELGRPTMYGKARDQVQEILQSPPLDPLPGDVAQALDDILLAADKAIGGDT